MVSDTCKTVHLIDLMVDDLAISILHKHGVVCQEEKGEKGIRQEITYPYGDLRGRHALFKMEKQNAMSKCKAAWDLKRPRCFQRRRLKSSVEGKARGFRQG